MRAAKPTPGGPAQLDALVALAQREQSAGRLTEAAAAYRKVVALRPDVAEAHINLGVVLAGQGELDEAVAQFEHALALRPDFAEAHNSLGCLFQWQGKLDEAAARFERAVALEPGLFQAQNSLGNVLRQQGKLDLAVARFEQAIALRPDLAETRYNLGNVLKDQGKLDEAAAQYQRAVALRPDLAEAHNGLGCIFCEQGRLDQAAAQFERAVALKPALFQAHNNLGNLLQEQGKFDQAVARYQQAIALKPDYAEAHNNLGNTLKQQGKLDQARARFEQALTFKPDYAEAHNNLGNVLLSQGNLDEAAARYEQALVLRPNLAQAHYNLGNTLKQQGKLEQAAARYRQTLALRPDYAEAHYNLGMILWQFGQLDQAAARFRQAIALRPDYTEAHWALATYYLAQEDYERGWPAYEGRLRTPGLLPPHSLPRWSGEPLAGRSLLLLAEQGLGDTLQFVRYARLLKERGARVVLAAQAPLGSLLACDPAWDELFILGSAVELPQCDFYLPLLSAPGAQGTNASTIPRDVPYLAADPDLTDEWRRELAGIEGFQIGIVWQGSRGYPWDRWRSIPLAAFAPLAKLTGVRLLSLQKGSGSEQIATVDFPVLDLSSRLDQVAGPFMDTAAVIGNLDLVVTPDTAIAHLAGALGAPVWLALQLSPTWRWLRGRDDSPWYPTMRLFRQTTFGEWSDVFERIANAVQKLHSETA